MDFVTTNIRLRSDIYQRLKLKSAHVRKSLAQLIREAVDQTYGGDRPMHQLTSPARRDALFRLVGVCRTGIRDGSVEHDRDIYGPKRSS
ncbi:MAG: hypothetical protein HY595_00320 [Candidatus Omnitrophica bacterium]|nr:hypothetical protein [Candidatus Omnitrophota bacterium]